MTMKRLSVLVLFLMVFSSCSNMGEDEIFSILLDGTAAELEAYIEENPDSINQLDARGRSPLGVLELTKRADMARILLAHGADPLHRYTLEEDVKASALEESIVQREVVIFPLLLDKLGDLNAPVEIETEEYGRMSFNLLHRVISYGSVEQLKVLIEKGVDLNRKSRNGTAPVQIAAKFFDEHTVKERADMLLAMLEAGADVNVQNKKGNTILHDMLNLPSASLDTATVETVRKCMNLALEKELDPNIQNKEGWTALHVAAYFQNLGAVNLLLEAGAKKNLKNIEGKTAADVAAEITRTDIAEVINNF